MPPPVGQFDCPPQGRARASWEVRPPSDLAPLEPQPGWAMTSRRSHGAGTRHRRVRPTGRRTAATGARDRGAARQRTGHATSGAWAAEQRDRPGCRGVARSRRQPGRLGGGRAVQRQRCRSEPELPVGVAPERRRPGTAERTRDAGVGGARRAAAPGPRDLAPPTARLRQRRSARRARRSSRRTRLRRASPFVPTSPSTAVARAGRRWSPASRRSWSRSTDGTRPRSWSTRPGPAWKRRSSRSASGNVSGSPASARPSTRTRSRRRSRTAAPARRPGCGRRATTWRTRAGCWPPTCCRTRRRR